MIRPIRDQKLLDALEALPQEPFDGSVWRSVKEGRDPHSCWRCGGRWDDRTFDVLYTSLSEECAVEERRFHHFQGQPIPPSKSRYEMFELSVSLEAVIRLDSLDMLAQIGMDTSIFARMSYAEKHVEYPASQQIAEACFFLGADGVIVPSARLEGGANLIVFCEQRPRPSISTKFGHGVMIF